MDGIIDHLLEHYTNETLQRAAIWFGPAVILAITLLREGWIAWRYTRSRFRAERLRIVRPHAGGVTSYCFLLLVITTFAAIKVGETPPFSWDGLPLFIAWVGAAIGAGVLAVVLRLVRKKEIANFIPHCPGCFCEMQNVTEPKLAALSLQQQCEVRAGGYMLEAWNCLACAAERVYLKKWFEAGKCPKCHWRTLRRWANVLERATSTRYGRMRMTLSCKNPDCGYSKTTERTISPTRRAK